MPRDDRCRRGGQTVQRSRLSIRGAPKESHLRQGPAFHFCVLRGVVQTAGDLAKPQHCLSPTNGRTVGENQSARRNSTSNLLQLHQQKSTFLIPSYSILLHLIPLILGV